VDLQASNVNVALGCFKQRAKQGTRQWSTPGAVLAPAVLHLLLTSAVCIHSSAVHASPPQMLAVASQTAAQPQQTNTQAVAVPPQAVQQTRQLLEWLGVLALLEQAPATLALSLEAEAKFRQASPQRREEWRHALEPQLQAASLQKALIQYVAERYKPATFQHATEVLEQPLARRARFFDLAMTQTNAVPGLKAYRTQLQAAPQAHRRAIVQELDAASAHSLLVAILQTGVGERVRRAADASSADADAAVAGAAAGIAADPQEQLSSIAQEFVERQRFLAPLTEDYLLYAYRYFKDEELTALRDLMRDAELQWLLDVTRQGLIAVLRDMERETEKDGA
jgi:hypothetical protein